MQKDPYALSRKLYILEAALEYFIDILVTSAYLAKIAHALGMSDSTIGILSSFISLAGTAMLAVLLLQNRRPVKRWVIPLDILSQLIYAALYFIPLFGGKGRLAAILFGSLLLIANILYRIIAPAKTNWMMSLIPSDELGIFSANKEIVSLIGGMLFSLLMSRLVDHFEAAGKLHTAFLLLGLTIFLLMLLHTLTLIFTKEKQQPLVKASVRSMLGQLFKTPTFRTILIISYLWSIINYSARPFFGAYEIGDLGFSMTFISILSISGSIIRILFSRPMGRFGDKHSFYSLLFVSFAIEALSFLMASLAVPSNGKIFYTIYTLLHYAAMAGINGGLLNLVYDQIAPEQCMGALAIRESTAGLLGFVITLISARLVDSVQKKGNLVFGRTIYAQQILSIVSFICCLIILVVIRFYKKSQNPQKQKK